MQELIRIQKHEKLVQAVDARELHTALEIKSKYADWIKLQAERADLTQDVDFITIHNNMTSPPSKEYFITVEAAKNIAMLSQTQKGKEVRAYFIDCERKLNEAKPVLTQLQMIAQMALEQDAANKRIEAVEERQRITEVKLEDFANGAEHYSITAYNKLFNNAQISHSEANVVGRQLSKVSKNQGIKLGVCPHPVWGTVNTYPKAMLDAFYRGEYLQ